jgi:hypothetical protein
MADNYWQDTTSAQFQDTTAAEWVPSEHALSADGAACNASIGSPALVQSHVLANDAVSCGVAIAALDMLQAHILPPGADLSADAAITAPDMLQVHAIGQGAVSCGTAITSISLTQVPQNMLIVSSISGAASITIPDLLQGHVLSVDGASSLAHAEAVTLIYNLLLEGAGGLSVEDTIGDIVLTVEGIEYIIIVDGLSAAASAQIAELIQRHSLSVDGQSIGAGVGSIILPTLGPICKPTIQSITRIRTVSRK